ERYLLPLSLFALFYLALTPLCWAQMFRKRERNRMFWVIPFFIALFSIAVFPHYVRFKDYYRAFARDSRQELCEYIATFLPPESFFACDKMVRLTQAQKHEGFEPSPMIEERYVSELGTLAELKAEGVTHVVISYDTYHRF